MVRAAGKVVYVADSDQRVREGLQYLLESEGLRAKTYSSGARLARACRVKRPACVILDAHLPDVDGLEFLESLASRYEQMPVIVLAGRTDVPTAVQAMKVGAADYLQKPVSDVLLLDCVCTAIESKKKAERRKTVVSAANMDLASLTPREGQVLKLVVTGMTSRQIASRLGIAQKTVEVHRKHIMKKTETRSTVELVRKLFTSSLGVHAV